MHRTVPNSLPLKGFIYWNRLYEGGFTAMRGLYGQLEMMGLCLGHAWL